MEIKLNLPFDPPPGSMVLDYLARNAGNVVASEVLDDTPGQPRQWSVTCHVKDGTEGHQVLEPAFGGILNG